ncbi:hypothetical protein ABZ464_39235 [Streptomyces sp. NPDC005820]|uniref:hypothetical protein n=1 Tax=Streptomyces sp. NPDC005820 TaxID=3157069 RepID=UPI0033D2CFB9
MTTSSARSARPRRTKAIVLGSVALAFTVALTTAAGFWWQEHNRPSQASKADCALAQRIVDDAQRLPGDKAAVDKWEQDTMRMRRAQMKDGYLGYNVAQYEEWATDKAKGDGTPPSDKEVLRLSDKANEHCADAKVAITFPPLAS